MTIGWCSVVVLGALLARPATAQEVSITNLFDSQGDAPGAVKRFGFSALVRAGGKTILFDGGSSAAVLRKNLTALKVDVKAIDLAIVSHRHDDHTTGFDAVLADRPQLKVYLPYDGRLGAPTPDPNPLAKSLASRFTKADRVFVKDAKEVVPGVHLIPTLAKGLHGDSKQDGHLPELSAAFKTKGGYVLLVGCSHGWVETIVRAARKHLKAKVVLVAGGYHLSPYGKKKVANLVKTLQGELDVASVAPAHCTGKVGLRLFKSAYKTRCLPFGLGQTIKR